MDKIAIYVENLSKQYMLGAAQQRQDTLRDVIVSTFQNQAHRVRAALSPQSEEARREREANMIWALKDVSLEIRQGEVVGIVGRNGAGKSTLLKILSRITEPTLGRVILDGRVGSLLEVGTGFHPELTGRENIYLNGTILGMKKVEIDRKFDEIVDFAEIEKFLDTPVKRYSSGMYVRLAFAVAAFLEPEILLVDEVLAVGDAEFQKKCLGKMGNVAQEGRTVLFVSHNMNAIQRLCPQSFLFEKGQLVEQGDTNDIVAHYLSSSFYSYAPANWIDLKGMSREGIGEAFFKSVWYSSDNESLGYKPYSNGPVEFALEVESNEKRVVPSIAVTIYDQFGTKLVNVDTVAIGKMVQLKSGKNLIKFRIEQLHLKPGIYVVGLWLANSTGTIYDYLTSAFKIEVVDFESQQFGMRVDGAVTCDFEFIEST